MRSYLLDTHSFLWMVSEPDLLSNIAMDILLDKENTLYVSVVSMLEISIKVSQGNLKIAQPLEKSLEKEIVRHELQLTPVNLNQLGVLSRLPFHHKDPFDRLLIAQSLSEKLPIVGRDAIFDRYGVTRIWE